MPSKSKITEISDESKISSNELSNGAKTRRTKSEFKWLQSKIRERLARKNLNIDFTGFEELLEIQDGVPDWWLSNDNLLLSLPGIRIPPLVMHPNIDPPQKAVVILFSNAGIGQIMLWDEGAMVVVRESCSLPAANLSCGGATVYLESNISSAALAFLDARNGGLIYVGRDGLWSNSIRMATDDMHAIRELNTGHRINPRGGSVIVGNHVWLGFEVMLMRGASIGDNSVIGARGIVNSEIPNHCVAVGVPARVVRDGITWNREDAD